MRVLLAGGSGFIGAALVSELTANGHSVAQLVRRSPASENEFEWHPERGVIDATILDGTDAVICLNGLGVGDKRWTDSYKQQLRDSRLQPVNTLVTAISAHGGPRVFVSASGIGYYGEAGDAELDESARAGSTYLAELCRDWEAASDPLTAHGVRVVKLRTGLVLDAGGGLLKRLGLLVKIGAGGRLGSGKQWQSWVSMADEVAAIRFLVEHDVSGPVNIVGPAAVRQVDFVKALAKQLHRPAFLPTPRFVLKAATGEFVDDLLASQRVLPRALTAAGYQFQHITVADALRWAYRH